jgi:hypothetical protein
VDTDLFTFSEMCILYAIIQQKQGSFRFMGLLFCGRLVMGMVDCVGKELKIGDKVICSDMNYADLLIGEVIGFTPKKARVRYHRSEYSEAYGMRGKKEQLKESYQIFKYEEVVRCKDCKWRNTKGCPYMNFNAAEREAEDYCSDGERKDNG